MKLDSQDLALAKVATIEGYRPKLTNLILRNGHWIATDGFMLVYRPASLSPDEKYTEDVALPADMIKKLAKPGTGALDVAVTPDKVTVKYPPRNNHGIKLNHSEYEIAFAQGEKPITTDLDELFARKDTDTLVEFSLGAPTFRKLLSVLPTNATIRFRMVTNREAPIEFQTAQGDPAIAGLVMPMVNSPGTVWTHPSLNIKKEEPVPAPAPEPTLVTDNGK